ncbi:MAG: CapA family protein, partial [Nakamurella sp.]
DLVYGHHAHVVQPMERINNKWAIYGLGNMIAAQQTPIDQTHEGLLVRVTFSQADDGSWSTSDVAWVASLQMDSAPFTWCALGTGAVCSTPDRDLTALTRTTEAVNLLGAAEDGAHPLVGE